MMSKTTYMKGDRRVWSAEGSCLGPKFRERNRGKDVLLLRRDGNSISTERLKRRREKDRRNQRMHNLHRRSTCGTGSGFILERLPFRPFEKCSSLCSSLFRNLQIDLAMLLDYVFVLLFCITTSAVVVPYTLYKFGF